MSQENVETIARLYDEFLARPEGVSDPGLLQFFAEFTAEWTLIAAAIAITASPLVLLYLFTQRYIIAGMTSGALKG